MIEHLQKLFKTVFAFIIVSIFILGLVYLGLGYYYRDSFSYGTRINGIYCTGHTPSEINTLLNERYSYDGLNIMTDDVTVRIDPEDIDFTYDFKAALSIYLNSQNPWMWPSNLISHRNRTLNPIVGFDIAKLEAILDSYELFNYDEPPVVSTGFEDGVYVLYDNTRHRPDSEAMREAIYDAIYDSVDTLVLDETYYSDAAYTDEQIAVIDEYNAMESMLGAHITYMFGDEEEVLDDTVISTFILRDDDGYPVMSEAYVETGEGDIYCWSNEAMDAWVDALADRHDTLGSTRVFNATGGFTVNVTGGIYGNKMDREAEKEYLRAAVRDKITDQHEPAYTQTALYQGSDDIGPTYVEVNMTDQKLYYYVDGELIIDTPVVTGNMGRHMNTPSGTNYVYYKQRNRTLIGPNYQTFVNYWIAVNGHIGIHDATWRDDFGGDIYLTSGSHGCVNTPMEAVSKLYDMIEIGTPVVMYYVEE